MKVVTLLSLDELQISLSGDIRNHLSRQYKALVHDEPGNHMRLTLRESVLLRGSGPGIFVGGVLSADSGIQKGDILAVYADIRPPNES